MEADPLDLSDEKFQFEKIVEIFKRLSIDFNNVNPVLKQEVERAAKLGWGCPIFNAVGVRYLLDIKDLDQDAYSSALGDAFIQNIASLQTNIEKYATQLDKPNRDLLKQVFIAFKNSHYQICMLALFSLIESSLLGFMDGDRKTTRYNNEYIAKPIKENGLLVTITLGLVSIHHLLNKYFEALSFENESDPKQNRHWSAHGRYRDYNVSKKEIIQLMSMLNVCLVTSVQINQFKEVSK
jgi:hypothetical protein